MLLGTKAGRGKAAGVFGVAVNAVFLEWIAKDVDAVEFRERTVIGEAINSATAVANEIGLRVFIRER